jgi:TetR/AcrR family transcriptional regulator, mexCD-oprJ operon repressor
VPVSDAVSVDPASDPSPRERRLDARRNLEAIIEAARTTFAADPGASMQEVASAAGLHRATVHRHFASREDLVAALRERAVEASLSGLREADLDEGPAPEALERGTRAVMVQAQHWQISRYAVPFQRAAAAEEIDRLVTALLARGQRERTVRDDVPPELLTLMWRGMFSTTGVLRERGMSTDEAADVVVRTLLGPGG